MKLAVLSVVAFVFMGATFASANTITFNFASTINSTSTTGSYAYSGDGVTITATGTADLFYKSAGVNEIGLGLTNNPYHEIGAGQSITLDLSSLFSKSVSSLSLTLDSIERASPPQCVTLT